MTCMAKRRVELDQWVNSDEQTWVSSCERQGFDVQKPFLPPPRGSLLAIPWVCRVKRITVQVAATEASGLFEFLLV